MSAAEYGPPKCIHTSKNRLTSFWIIQPSSYPRDFRLLFLLLEREIQTCKKPSFEHLHPLLFLSVYVCARSHVMTFTQTLKCHHRPTTWYALTSLLRSWKHIDVYTIIYVWTIFSVSLVIFLSKWLINTMMYKLSTIPFLGPERKIVLKYAHRLENREDSII